MTLEKEIKMAINRVSAENGSDTPDFILAEYLVGCLEAWNKASRHRDKWYGFKDQSGAATLQCVSDPKTGEIV